MKLRAILSAALVVAATSHGINWPIPPIDQPHPLGLNWGNYQDYTGIPRFLHWGIDVITPDTAGVEVRSVSHGWVKGWGTIEANLHYCLLVCDTSPDFTGRAEGWGYGHIDSRRFHKNEGDEVQEGELIGYLVDFPVDSSFDHLHFCRISDTGAYWHRYPNFTAWFVQNPLTIITPNTDLEPPVIENARGGDRFAFCRDNVDNDYLDADSLVGAVDIIARVYDKTGHTTGDTIWDKLAPFKLEHMIKKADNDSVVRPWILSLKFSNLLDDSCVNVLYKDDDTCPSCGDFLRREYCYIITNTDGDSVMERSDTTGNWNTAGVDIGDYWVIVRAWDVYGNSVTDSMLVTVCGVAIEDLPSLALSAPLRALRNPGPGPTGISFGIDKPAHVRLCVLDAAGRVVAMLADHRLAAGQQRFQARLPAGVYLVQVEFDGRSRQSVKVVVTE